MIRRVNPEGPSARSAKTFRYRVYETSSPNFVWYIDGNHKFVRWGFVTHSAIDGFSMLLTFAGTCDNNEHETTFLKLSHAVNWYP